QRLALDRGDVPGIDAGGCSFGPVFSDVRHAQESAVANVAFVGGGAVNQLKNADSGFGQRRRRMGTDGAGTEDGDFSLCKLILNCVTVRGELSKKTDLLPM